MNLSNKLLSLHESVGPIKKAMTKKLEEFDIADILKVTDVDKFDDGSIAVEFTDDDGDSLDCVFVHEDGKTYVYYVEDFEDEDDIDGEVEVSDLGIEIPTVKGKDGAVSVDLTNLEWLNLETFLSVISELDDLEEAFAYVVRNGKKVKKTLVRKRRKRIMTAKMRQGVRKAVRSRKKKKVSTARNRKKSLRIRKRMKLKKNTRKNLKVSGTSSYRK